MATHRRPRESPPVRVFQYCYPICSMEMTTDLCTFSRLLDAQLAAAIDNPTQLSSISQGPVTEAMLRLLARDGMSA